ncbi:MAG: hypothetical protein RRY76_05440 [Clostridia bacterium]
MTDGTAEINFCENITENNKGYEFDMYTLIILSTKDTEKHVKEKSDIYLKIAKENENFRIE